MSGVDRPVRELQRFRDRVLEAGKLPGDGRLRPAIANSWRRCLLSGVSPEVLAPRERAADDLDSQFLRAAQPVMEKCVEQLEGASAGVMVGDRRGLVLSMWSGDDRLGRLLDDAHSSSGFFLDESVAGTNGVGTVLEEQRPVQISGGEHFVDAFQPFTCVGVPIRHPITRQLRGVLNLSCRVEDANSLLLPFALQVARDIEGRLYLDSSRRERLLLEQFLSVDRRTTRPVVVLNDQAVITNPPAARFLDGADHTQLWEQAARVVGSHREQDIDLVLSSGEILRTQCRPVIDGRAVVGAVIEFDIPTVAKATTQVGDRCGTEPALPGLVGGSAAWRDVCRQALDYRDSPLPLLLTGEAGVGKLALLHALFEPALSGGGLCVLDAALQRVEPTRWLATLAEAMRGEPKVVVIRHLHALDQSAAQAVGALVDEAVEGVRVVATRDSGEEVYQPLLDRLSVITIDMPPLRDRLDDLRALLSELSHRHAAAGTSTPRWLPDAVQVLRRLDWPANVRQLDNLVQLVLTNRRTGDIRASDLPENVRSQAPRRALSHLEAVTLKEIMSVLRRVHGNKTAAADLLGISRATLYRKLRAFGVDLERTAF